VLVFRLARLPYAVGGRYQYRSLAARSGALRAGADGVTHDD